MTRQGGVLGLLLMLAGCAESGTLLPDGAVGDDDDVVGDDDDATGNASDQDGDGDPSSTDCDDNDPSAFNGNQEICGDPADNDCDPDTVCYTARIGSDTQPMQPVVGERGPADWYANVAMGEEGVPRSDSVVVLLYRRSDQRAVNLIFTLDGWEDGSGGVAFASLQGLGGASLLLVDDQGEGEVSGGNGSFGFQWVDCCVDGAVIGPLDPGACVDFGIPESEGLGGGWIVRDGDSEVAMGATTSVLEICETQ